MLIFFSCAARLRDKRCVQPCLARGVGNEPWRGVRCRAAPTAGGGAGVRERAGVTLQRH